MSSSQHEPGREPEHEPESGADEDDARTPFDNPWLLPVLLTAGAIWFGYDGFLNQDPGMKKYWWFNQPGAVLLALGAIWTTLGALRERKRAQEPGLPGSSDPG